MFSKSWISSRCRDAKNEVNSLSRPEGGSGGRLSCFSCRTPPYRRQEPGFGKFADTLDFVNPQFCPINLQIRETQPSRKGDANLELNPHPATHAKGPR